MSHSKEEEDQERYKDIVDALEYLELEVKGRQWSQALKRIRYIKEEIL